MTQRKEETALWGAFLWTCFLLGLVMVATTGCESIPRAFLEGEEAAYKAIVPAYRQYVESDVTLSGDQRDDRLRTLRAWRYSLDKAEGVSK